MTPADFDDFSKIVVGFAELRGRELSAPAIKLFWNAMQHWTLDDFKVAANQLLSTSKFMPTPYDFEQLRRAGELKGPEAWALVLNGAEIDPNSRAYRAAQCVGGQYYIRHCDEERTLPHVERRFLEAYQQLSDVEPIREALPQIAKPTHRLRGPTSIANCLPGELKRAEPAARQAVELPTPPPATPKVLIADSVRVERLARAMPTATDEELAKVARVDVAIVCQVRAALEAA